MRWKDKVAKSSIISARQLAIFLSIHLAVIISALVVVYTVHSSRALFNRLQLEQKQRDDLEIEWGRLLLEQSTWGAYGRVERIAEEKLLMKIPDTKELILIQMPGDSLP